MTCEYARYGVGPKGLDVERCTREAVATDDRSGLRLCATHEAALTDKVAAIIREVRRHEVGRN